MMIRKIKTSRCLCAVLAFAAAFAATEVKAQDLPSNPWAQNNSYQEMQTQQGPVQIIAVRPVYGSQPIQPVYEGGASNPWNTRQPTYTGQLTTWGDNVGQVPNAPEVNMHNTMAIVQHLRNMGYNIPSSFEAKFKAAPASIQAKINAALRSIKSGRDPFSKGTKFLVDKAEQESGMTFDNIFNNSMRLLSAK